MNIPIEKVPMILIEESAKNDLAALVQKYEGFPTYVIESALVSVLIKVQKRKQKEIEQAYAVLMTNNQKEDGYDQKKDECGGE